MTGLRGLLSTSATGAKFRLKPIARSSVPIAPATCRVVGRWSRLPTVRIDGQRVFLTRSTRPPS